MTKVIRFVIFFALLLIVPTGATPPAKYSCAGSLACQNIPAKTVLIRKYRSLRRFPNRDEARADVQICDITVVVVLNRATITDTPQPTDSSNLLAIRSYKKCQSVQEVVDEGTCNRPVLPML
jgi:hypothetical protein